jgi:hypothetical protein
MFRLSTAHHQEVRCVYVANGTYKMTVSEHEGVPCSRNLEPSTETLGFQAVRRYLHNRFSPPSHPSTLDRAENDVTSA